MAEPRTLAGKLWDRHRVCRLPSGEDLLYIDLHLLNEVTSPPAFEALRTANRPVRRPDLTLATEDHNVPTVAGATPEPASAHQLAVLRAHCAHFGVPLRRRGRAGQGIVHVIAPEEGLTLPGMSIVCGDSHTSTHGAFGALAMGIGTSDVEHVLATQTLALPRPRDLRVRLEGRLGPGVTVKDLALAVIRTLGTGGGAGSIVEYQGALLASMSMEGRMTLCNMTIEAGARAALVAPDVVTLDYLRGRASAPVGPAWEAAVADWATLHTDAGARWDADVAVDASTVVPTVSWGTHPGQGVPLTGVVPEPQTDADRRALHYMDLAPGTPLRAVAIDAAFLGSCTNGRLEDLRAAAEVVRGRQVADGVRALVVPGSTAVKQAAEAEGLDAIFRRAGFSWRESGCSMCLGMNDDRLQPGERCVSSSNRNYEGRQGPGGRTHLASPVVVAASAIAGRLAGPGDLP